MITLITLFLLLYVLTVILVLVVSKIYDGKIDFISVLIAVIPFVNILILVGFLYDKYKNYREKRK